MECQGILAISPGIKCKIDTWLQPLGKSSAHLSQRWMHIKEKGAIDVVTAHFSKVSLIPTKGKTKKEMRIFKLSYNPNSLNKAWLKLQLKAKAMSFKQLMRNLDFFLKTKAFHNKRFKEARHQAGH